MTGWEKKIHRKREGGGKQHWGRMIWQGLAEAYRMSAKVSVIFTWPKGRESARQREKLSASLDSGCCDSSVACHFGFRASARQPWPRAAPVSSVCVFTNRDRAQTGWGESLWQSCVKQGRITLPSRGREGEDRWDWPLCHHSGQYDICVICANVCVCVYKKNRLHQEF